jgi:hypothetical protein
MSNLIAVRRALLVVDEPLRPPRLRSGKGVEVRATALLDAAELGDQSVDADPRHKDQAG